MKASSLKMTLSTMNFAPYNIFIGVLAFINCFLYSFIPLKRLLRSEVSFNNIGLSCVWGAVCFFYILRLFFNKTSSRFARTVKSAKLIYTRNVSVLIELVNTAIYVFVFLGVIVIFNKGCTSSLAYVMILVYSVFHLLVSVITPRIIKLVSYEGPLFMSLTAATKLDDLMRKIFWCLFMIIPGLISSFIAKPLAENLPPLSIQGLSFAAGISIIVIVISCILNRFLIERGYTFNS